MNKQQAPDGMIEQIKQQLQVYSNGQCPVCVEYHQGQASVQLMLGRTWWVKPTDALLKNIQEILGADSVAFVYA